MYNHFPLNPVSVSQVLCHQSSWKPRNPFLFPYNLKVPHSSKVSAVPAVGLEVPHKVAGLDDKVSPSLNTTFNLNGTTGTKLLIVRKSNNI